MHNTARRARHARGGPRGFAPYTVAAMIAVAVITVIAVAGIPVMAHALQANTAKVTLRDGHLDLVADIDLFALATQSSTQLATGSEAALRDQATELKNRLLREVTVQVDGVRIPLVLREFPTALEIRALAAELSSKLSDHGTLVHITFESPTDANLAAKIAVQMPVALGPTLVSFVQPASHYANAGDTATFTVTRPLRTAINLAQITHGTSHLSLVVGLASALAIISVALLSVFGLRRLRRSSVAAIAVIATSVGCQQTSSTVAPDASGQFKAEVWVDNWFAMYVNQTLVGEDAVPITTEKSFNATTLAFDATYPFELNLVLKDYKANDTGLEYIGTAMQQIGDGGFIMQVTDTLTGNIIAVSSSAVRCLVIHKAPLNPSCEKDANPTATCRSQINDEPIAWKAAATDTSTWQAAQVYSATEIGVKGGYNDISWDASAKLIWTSDLKADNTLLCKITIVAPQ